MYNSIYPAYISSYSGLNNKKITKKEDDEKNSQSSRNAEKEVNQEAARTNSASYFPNGEKTAIDYTKNQVGINQVLSDFVNTTNAIGAPDEIKTEVYTYLSLIEKQSQKENPNQKIIRSNLKNASQILDGYITDTLKKPSKVVENWVDALFLKQINYKSEKQSPDKTETEVSKPDTFEAQEIQTGETDTSKQNISEIYIPQDNQLKSMFIRAKKYAAVNNSEKSLAAFQIAMDYAEEIGDSRSCAIIHYEQGRLYDSINQVEDALYNYNIASNESSDDNIKAKSHYYMGGIYDDYVKFEPAAEHYGAAAAYAGKADNLKLQTKAFSDLAQIHSEKYDKDNAFMFMDMAVTVAQETNDGRITGIISSKNGKMCEKLGNKSKALNSYASSAESFSKINDNENLAKNYRNAAEIMLQYGNSAKAKKLLSKAYIAAQNTDNPELKTQISQELAIL